VEGEERRLQRIDKRNQSLPLTDKVPEEPFMIGSGELFRSALVSEQRGEEVAVKVMSGCDGFDYGLIGSWDLSTAQTQDGAKDREDGAEGTGKDARQGVSPIAQLQVLLPKPDQPAVEFTPALRPNVFGRNLDPGKRVGPVEQPSELLDVGQLKREDTAGQLKLTGCHQEWSDLEPFPPAE
jgi:hypothetical protein